MAPKKFTKTLVSKLSKEALKTKAEEYGFTEKCLKPKYVEFFMHKRDELGDARMMADFSDLFAAMTLEPPGRPTEAATPVSIGAVPRRPTEAATPVSTGAVPRRSSIAPDSVSTRPEAVAKQPPAVEGRVNKTVTFSAMDDVSEFHRDDPPVEAKKEFQLDPVPAAVPTRMFQRIRSAKSAAEIMAVIRKPEVAYLRDLAHIDDAMMRAFGLA